MIDKEPAQKIIDYLESKQGFEFFWHELPKKERQNIIQEIAEIIDEHIEFNWR